MKLKHARSVDVFELFVHDRYDCAPFDPEYVADALTVVLCQRLSDADWRVVSPQENGLSRFTLTRDDVITKYQSWTKRCHDVAAVKAYLPPEVIQVLSLINGDTVRLGAG